MSDARSLLDRTFLSRHRSLLASRFPIGSDFYEVLDAHHRARMDAFDSRWSPSHARPLSEASRAFVNDCFATVEAAVSPALSACGDAVEGAQRARSIYGYRLAQGATIADFRACDVFDGVLPPSDTHVPTLLAEGGPTNEIRKDFRDGMCHVFLHAPQRTPYLFLHEMFVGYLGNVCANQGEIRRRSAFAVAETDTWRPPARFVVDLAAALGRTPEEVVSLHFASAAHIEATLPQSILDLSTIAGHIYWYLEVFLVKIRGAKMTHAVNFLLSLFVFPSLDRWMENPRLTLVEDAGELVDEAFVCRILSARTSEGTPDAGEVDVVRLLCELERRLWTTMAPSA